MGSITIPADLYDSAISPAPDFSDEESYEGIVDKDIAKRLSVLIGLKDQIRKVNSSEFPLNKDRALEWLVVAVEELETDLRDKWEQA